MNNDLCPICLSKREVCFEKEVLKKYKVMYLYCIRCGFLQTERPYWMEEAYQDAITLSDTGLIQRNIYIAKTISCLIYFFLDKDGKYLDYGGGYGILTRLMRDYGFDFYWYDKYCPNLFAREFDLSQTKPPIDAILAIEVIEHIYNTIPFINEMLQLGAKTLVISTEVFNDKPPKPEEWWYYGFESGQHISFFQIKTLSFIAQKLGLYLYSNKKNFHILTDKKLRPLFSLLFKRPVSSLLFEYIKRRMKSKTFSDYESFMCQGQ